MWRERAIKWAWFTLLVNATIAIMNAGFAYGHFSKHEIWTGIISSLLVCMNGWIAYWQWGHIKTYKRELKELMWKTLATPSDALR